MKLSEDTRDILDAIFPRAMIWGFVIAALLALGTLGAKAEFREVPNPMFCAPINEFIAKVGSFGVKIIAKGNLHNGTIFMIVQQESGQFHNIILHPGIGMGCAVVVGKNLEILETPIPWAAPKAPEPPKETPGTAL